MHSKRIALVAVSVLLGVMISLQYKSTRDMQHSVVSMRAEDLYQQLVQVEQEKEELQNQIKDLRAGKDEERTQHELDNLRYRAGLTDVEGPGIIVTVSDSKQPLKMGENQNIYLVHDEDILKIINELRAAGAEAIAINDQRLTATSEIRCAGPTITVNGKLFGPPFRIQAIGEPKLLGDALRLRGGVADTLKYWGIDLLIEEKNHLRLPAYKGAPKTDFAKPIMGGES